MSSESVPARFPLRRVALFGGGRWSRVLLPVIQSLLSEEAEVLWMTEHGYQRALQWLHDRAIQRVLVQRAMDFRSVAIEAAVVATSPVKHGEHVRNLLNRGIPTFCEKPFTLEFGEAAALHRLALDARCPVGVNLEMYFASYIEDFARVVCGRNVREIAITWFDPWSENRYGELKHGDVYTSIVDDMWPHCWSIFRRLFPDCNVSSVEDVRYEPSTGQVQFVVRINEVVATIALGRRADQRTRKINLNHGEAVLDFSTEPGFSEVDGAMSANEWRGLRPLSRSLSSFFEVVQRPELSADWELSKCLDAVRSAQAIGGKLKSVQLEHFRRLRETGVELSNAVQRNLIVDLLLPEYSAKDRRWPAITLEEQITFVRHVCDTQGIRYR